MCLGVGWIADEGKVVRRGDSGDVLFGRRRGGGNFLRIRLDVKTCGVGDVSGVGVGGNRVREGPCGFCDFKIVSEELLSSGEYRIR